jgi:parallel beta-helix repeat protein
MRAIPIRAVAALSLLAAGCHAGDDLAAPIRSHDPALASRQPLHLPAVIVACGESVVADLKLGNDLVCAGDALIVNADGITLDLNGHTIAGSGTGNGITVRGRQNVTIHGGTITGFTTGAFIANSSGVVIKDNRFTQNREGVFLNGSSNNLVIENEAWQNQLRGIMLRPTLSGTQSTGNLVKENDLRENPSGILVFGQPGNTFKENRISESSFAAIDLTGGGATGNLFKENVLERSAAGISFGAGWTGNTISENTLFLNTCGTQGTTAGNTFTENRFVANGTDFC